MASVILLPSHKVRRLALTGLSGVAGRSLPVPLSRVSNAIVCSLFVGCPGMTKGPTFAVKRYGALCVLRVVASPTTFRCVPRGYRRSTR